MCSFALVCFLFTLFLILDVLGNQILVDECKEAILELSGREETFFGPYEMPLLKVMLKSTEEENNEEEGAEEEGDESQEPPAEDVTAKARQHMAPSEESLEMLRKLEPLPALLEDFDLDAHVGLIQRVMKEDPKLVAMQANFSGGGLREKVFWRNYFFHCAFARYEAGLSLDEIWSYREEQPSAVDQAETAPTEGIENHTEAENDAENIVEVSAEASTDAPLDLGDAAGTTENATERSELSPTNGFELLDDADVAVETNPELDELEAEIARELADM